MSTIIMTCDLSRTYLAHHELESGFLIIITTIIVVGIIIVTITIILCGYRYVWWRKTPATARMVRPMK